MIEDVLVKVDEFYIFVDFLILDMEYGNNPSQIPIILGQPFFATANACINYRTGAMDIMFGNQKLRLDIFKVTQGPLADDFGEVNVIEEIINETTPMTLSQDPLEICLAHFRVDDFDEDGHATKVNALSEEPHSKIAHPWTIKYEPLLALASTPTAPSLELPQL